MITWATEENPNQLVTAGIALLAGLAGELGGAYLALVGLT